MAAAFEFLGRTQGHDVAAVEENDAIGDQEGAGEFVRHHDHSHGVGFFEVQDEIVDAGGGDGVEARGGFIEEQDVGIHGQRAGECGAFAHASAELRRAVVLEAAEAHLFQLDANHDLDGSGLEGGVFEQGQGDVFADPQGADQCPALKGQTDLLADGVHLAGRSPGDVGAIDMHLAGRRFFEAHQRPEQGTLAGAGAAEHDYGFAGKDIEGEGVQNLAAAVCDREAARGDDGCGGNRVSGIWRLVRHCLTRFFGAFRCRFIVPHSPFVVPWPCHAADGRPASGVTRLPTRGAEQFA